MDVNSAQSPSFLPPNYADIAKAAKDERSWFVYNKTYVYRNEKGYDSYTLTPWERIKCFFNREQVLAKKIKSTSVTTTYPKLPTNISKVNPHDIFIDLLNKSLMNLQSSVKKAHLVGTQTLNENASIETPKSNLQKIKILLENYSNKFRDPKSGLAQMQKTDKKVLAVLKELEEFLNKENENGVTPFEEAIISNDQDLVELSLRFGANPNRVNSKSNRTPITLAIENELPVILQTLIKNKTAIYRTDVNQVDGTNYTPLTLAVSKPNTDMLKILIGLGKPNLNLNAQDGVGKTPVMIAVEQNKKEHLKLLIEAGADLNQEIQGKNLIQYAILRDDPDLLETIFQLKPELLNKEDRNGLSPFAYAIANVGKNTMGNKTDNETELLESFKVIKYFIATQAEVKASRQLWPPLIYAAEVDRPELIEAMLNFGEDLSKINYNNMTVLFFVVINNKTNILKSMVLAKLFNEPKQQNRSFTFPYVVWKGDQEKINYLIAAGANLNQVDSHSKTTPVELTILIKNYTVLNHLLVEGANVNFINPETGSTPLTKAVNKYDIEAIKILLKHKANVNLRNQAKEEQQLTPLELAINNGSIKIVRLLMLWGANPQKPNEKTGTTPRSHIENFNKYLTSILDNTPHNEELGEFLFSFDLDPKTINKDKAAKEFNYSPLTFAIKENKDIKLVEDLLKIGADPNEIDSHGKSPLEYAIDRGNPDLIKLLHKHGVNFNKKNSSDINPLTYARNQKKDEISKLIYCLQNNISTSQFEEISKYLTEFNTNLFELDFNKTNKDGLTPLTLAIQQKNIELTKTFLELGADPNHIDQSGKTILEYAIDNEDLESIKLLKKYHADLNKVNEKTKLTPFAYALTKNKSALFAYFIESKAIIQDGTLREGKIVNWTPLHFASNLNSLDNVNTLLELGQDPNELSWGGWNALKYAIWNDKENILNSKDLLSKFVSQQSKVKQNSYLSYTAFVNKKIMINKLIDAGADIDEIDTTNWTPLTNAANAGNLEIANNLIERGADLNKPNGYKSAPIDDAIRADRINMTRYLMLMGAKLQEKRGNIWSSLELLEFKNNPNKSIIKNILLNTTPNKDLAQFLIKFDMDPNQIDKESNCTPLTLAIKEGRYDLIEPLIKIGAKIDEKDGNGCTPLTYAIKRPNFDKKIDFLEVLLKNGARRDLPDGSSKTPIEHIIDFDSSGQESDPRISMLEILVKENPTILGQLNRDGLSPLAYAMQNEKLNLLKPLLLLNAPVIRIFNGQKQNLTPIEFSIEIEKPNVLRKLYQEGENPKIPNDEGVLPLEYAIKNNKKSHLMLSHLIELGGFQVQEGRQTVLTQAINDFRSDIVYALINAGINPAVADGLGDTPLYFAMRSRNNGILTALIKTNRVDVNQIDKEGWTPLSYAVSKHDYEKVELLMKSKADPKIANENGKTPIELAVEIKEKTGNDEIFKLLSVSES